MLTEAVARAVYKHTPCFVLHEMMDGWHPLCPWALGSIASIYGSLVVPAPSIRLHIVLSSNSLVLGTAPPYPSMLEPKMAFSNIFVKMAIK